MAFYHWLGPAMGAYNKGKKEAEKENVMAALEKIKMQQLVDQAAMEKIKFGEWQKDAPVNDLKRAFEAEQYGADGIMRKRQGSEMADMASKERLRPMIEEDTIGGFAANKNDRLAKEFIQGLDKEYLPKERGMGLKKSQADLDKAAWDIKEAQANIGYKNAATGQLGKKSTEERLSEMMLSEALTKANGDPLLAKKLMQEANNGWRGNDKDMSEANKAVQLKAAATERRINKDFSMKHSQIKEQIKEAEKSKNFDEADRLNKQLEALISETSDRLATIPRTVEDEAAMAAGSTKGFAPRYEVNNDKAPQDPSIMAEMFMEAQSGVSDALRQEYENAANSLEGFSNFEIRDRKHAPVSTALNGLKRAFGVFNKRRLGQ